LSAEEDVDFMRRVWLAALSAGFLFSISMSAQTNACDLAAPYGTVDSSDVQAAVNMSLGSSPCTANVVGSGVCNVVVVQRVINASLGQGCMTGSGHSVGLNWNASSTPNVTYKIYRTTISGGPYTFLASPGTAINFTDPNIQSGQTYYYVVTSVDSSNKESVFSNQTQALVP